MLMKTIRVRDFDLYFTLNSGQVFRYERVDERFVVSTADCLFSIRQEGDTLEFSGIGKRELEHYFRLDVPISPQVRRLSEDRFLKNATRKYRGLRIVRQNPWECLISFATATCCNIPRIKKLLTNLCEACGSRIRSGKHEGRSFPKPGAFNNEARLRSIGFGYRAQYLAELSRHVNIQWLEGLRQLEYSDARRELCSLPGVGKKVADCTLLFSLGFDEAFPIDVHIRRCMQQRYFNGSRVSDRAIAAFAREHFAGDAGLAQQYMFCEMQNT